jgi:hypothetical protein
MHFICFTAASSDLNRDVTGIDIKIAFGKCRRLCFKANLRGALS